MDYMINTYVHSATSNAVSQFSVYMPGRTQTVCVCLTIFDAHSFQTSNYRWKNSCFFYNRFMKLEPLA